MGNKTKPAAERRQNERHPVKMNVEVSAPQGKRKGTTVNLSETGAFISLDQPVDPGTDIVIHFHLKDGSRHQAKGRVLYCVSEDLKELPHGMGVFFEHSRTFDAIWRDVHGAKPAKSRRT